LRPLPTGKKYSPRDIRENHPNTVTITNNYLQMLLEAPTEEILKALPEEMHKNYLKMRSDRENK